MPDFAKLFEQAVRKSASGLELEEGELETLRLLHPDLSELIELRHMVNEGEPLFVILLGRIERVKANLDRWCDLADETTEDELGDAIYNRALQRIRTVEVDPGEIGSAICVRGPEDPVRKVLVGRLAGRRRFGGE